MELGRKTGDGIKREKQYALQSYMNILICHERFLFRFGADRTLILLGKGMKDLGHDVAIMANVYDADVVASFASRVIDCPSGGASYLDLSEFIVEWLHNNWSHLFPSGSAPDVVVVGGWPFLSAITFFRQVCAQVIFVDFGAVPTYGYTADTVIVLEKLRFLRRLHLPDASLVVAISQFIADSQSRPDSGGAVPVRAILLGADHMEREIWPATDLHFPVQRGSALNTISSLRKRNKQILLCLGRWEPGCYKQSEAAFEVMEQVTKHQPECVLLLLEEASKVEVPVHLGDTILPIGFPDDRELAELMEQADLGISLSLWEGFNLPLAEMQWLGKAALVLNVGAHPEVVAHPWYLCESIGEMSEKAIGLLRGNGPHPAATLESLTRFRNHFRWDRFIREYAEILVEPRENARVPISRPLILVDVTSSTKDPSNPGVIRVARRLSRELQQHGHDPLFVVWDHNAERYSLPTEAEHATLSRFNGPIIDNTCRLSESTERRTSVDGLLGNLSFQRESWLLLPEVMMESAFREIRHFARSRDLKIAAIFYDSIPVLRPDLCNEQIRDNHEHYMNGLAECDLVMPISQFSSKCLEDFWRESGISLRCDVVVDVLPGEFGGARRNTIISNQQVTPTANILCVSTLEPRKNHSSLIRALLQVSARRPDFSWTLTLVGNRYLGAFEIADWVQEISAKEPRIQWLGVVDDATLDRLYQESAFTVYPSIIEGFGLPILESIWHGRPCICYNQGVMAELAEGGGCLTVEVTDPVQLGEAIYTLATEEDLRLQLNQEATKRPLKTWGQYVAELTGLITRHSDATTSGNLASEIPSADTANGLAWQRALYAECLCDNWQMNDSERMALTALLARHKPSCSIEVGTYHGGSLSLISQYSRAVFSIDTDSTVPTRLTFPNVSFLTGLSTVILPLLLQELDRAGTPAEFILIDGDHSASGVLGDIDCLLRYVPKRPLFVLLHDSFNPECRRGMLEARWESSAYCHWVDVDFVPGRMVETPGPFRGELWGGLAAAYFRPVPRTGQLQVGKTAEGMYQALRAGRSVAALAHA